MTFTTPIHTNEQSVDRVLNAGLPTLLVFWRDDCAPCRQLDPTLDRLAAAYAGKALIAKVNVKDNSALPRRYSIAQLPGLVFVKDGKPAGQGSGAAPEASLRMWFDYLIAGGARPPNPVGPSVPLESASSPVTASAATRQSGSTQAASAEVSDQPITLSDATFDQIVGRSNKPVLVDFWAPWCGPCRMVAPTVEQLAREFAGRAVVAKLNVDDNPRTAERFNVRGIPTLMIFKEGRPVERLVGVQPPTVLRQALARHASA
ncbi:MAG: hypothetical protein KatS3mg053_2230 [Candidatus Roseilinea sp.]|nr:MAG: hypothetical protein KatS3mg053_2230 [Candidatus Roseilinea sp.]